MASRTVRVLAALATLLPLGAASAAEASTAHSTAAKPTIVLVHGAWADSSSWNAVIQRLIAVGYPVVAAPNPLRGLKYDSDTLADFLSQITGPVVLVGHSYGGAVISDAAVGNPNVEALVFDDAYIPAAGETVAALSGADSALAPAATDPTSVFKLVPNGDTYDTYLLPEVVATDFAPDLPKAVQGYLTRTQPPTSLLALGEPAAAPAWTTVPSWDIVGKQDKIIPLAAQLSMAQRAGSHVTEINSSHVSLISHPVEVAAVILKAVHATD
jgi:pimeloyl-ACP methyl ester carboxylesterase